MEVGEWWEDGRLRGPSPEPSYCDADEDHVRELAHLLVDDRLLLDPPHIHIHIRPQGHHQGARRKEQRERRPAIRGVSEVRSTHAFVQARAAHSLVHTLVEQEGLHEVGLSQPPHGHREEEERRQVLLDRLRFAFSVGEEHRQVNENPELCSALTGVAGVQTNTPDGQYAICLIYGTQSWYPLTRTVGSPPPPVAPVLHRPSFAASC
jgi:hypothetical protein